jgi:transcription elongation GreA/GreB family factor
MSFAISAESAQSGLTRKEVLNAILTRSRPNPITLPNKVALSSRMRETSNLLGPDDQDNARLTTESERDALVQATIAMANENAQQFLEWLFSAEIAQNPTDADIGHCITLANEGKISVIFLGRLDDSVITVHNREIEIVSPDSKLGLALVGKKIDETIIYSDGDADPTEWTITEIF